MLEQTNAAVHAEGVGVAHNERKERERSSIHQLGLVSMALLLNFDHCRISLGVHATAKLPTTILLGFTIAIEASNCRTFGDEQIGGSFQLP